MLKLSIVKDPPQKKNDISNTLKRKTRNISITVVCLIIILGLLTVSILNEIGSEKWSSFYNIFRTFFELLYFSSGIVLIIGLVIGYQQLVTTNRDIKIRNERMSVEKSLDYLDFFSNSLLPRINQFLIASRDAPPLAVDRWIARDNDFKIDVFSLADEVQVDILRGLVTRQELGLQDIFNQLEFFSAGIMHGLAKEEVVYMPISGLFCRFIDKEMIALCSSRGQGSPYENLISLYKKWNLRKETDAKLLQIQEAEHIIELTRQQVAADVEATRPQRPLGL